MNEDYYKQQAARVRSIASLADPFTKRRLLALAEQYDAAKPSPRRSVPIRQPLDNNSQPVESQSQPASLLASMLISEEILSEGTRSGDAGTTSLDARTK